MPTQLTSPVNEIQISFSDGFTTESRVIRVIVLDTIFSGFSLFGLSLENSIALISLILFALALILYWKRNEIVSLIVKTRTTLK